MIYDIWKRATDIVLGLILNCFFTYLFIDGSCYPG